MKVKELIKFLEDYPEAEIGFFDDNADEYGDFDGEVFIGLEKIETQPIDESENYLYLLPNPEAKITDNVVK